ncbi:MAG: TetR/AcrR family transcriptional regulator [Rhizomicrobium sp.]
MKSPAGARKKTAATLQRKAAPRKLRAYHKGNVAQDLLLAARRILRDESFEDVSVRRLAREVGVTPANFYNHFESLEALLLSLGAEGFDEIRLDAEQIIASAQSRKEALLQRCFKFVKFAMTNKQVFRIMFGQIPNAHKNQRFREASDASFGQLMHLIYGKDIYDPTDLAGMHYKGRAAYAVLAMVYGLARNIIEDQFQFETGSDAEIRKFVEDVLSTLLDGTVAKELSW